MLRFAIVPSCSTCLLPAFSVVCSLVFVFGRWLQLQDAFLAMALAKCLQTFDHKLCVVRGVVNVVRVVAVARCCLLQKIKIKIFLRVSASSFNTLRASLVA